MSEQSQRPQDLPAVEDGQTEEQMTTEGHQDRTEDAVSRHSDRFQQTLHADDTKVQKQSENRLWHNGISANESQIKLC